MSLNLHAWKIIVADNQTLIREALGHLISGWPEMEVIAEACTTEEAWQLARKLIPDVLILSIPICSFLGLNSSSLAASNFASSKETSFKAGSSNASSSPQAFQHCDSTPIQVIERLKASYPRVRVLGLSSHRDEVHLHQLVAAGIAGYLLKESGAAELGKALRVLATGGAYLDPSIEGQIVDGRIQLTPSGSSLFEEQLNSLSPVQIEILKMVAWGHTNNEMAERLHFSVKTIEGYKAAIGKKLGLRTRAEMVRFALQHGWLSIEE